MIVLYWEKKRVVLLPKESTKHSAHLRIDEWYRLWIHARFPQMKHMADLKEGNLQQNERRCWHQLLLQGRSLIAHCTQNKIYCAAFIIQNTHTHTQTHSQCVSFNQPSPPWTHSYTNTVNTPPPPPTHTRACRYTHTSFYCFFALIVKDLYFC